MDAFGDDFGADVDPAAEFLAREQNDLAGIVDDFKPEIPVPFVEPTHDDFLMSAPATNEPASNYDDFGFGSEPQLNGQDAAEENLCLASIDPVTEASKDFGQGVRKFEEASIDPVTEASKDFGQDALNEFEEVSAPAPAAAPRTVSPLVFSQAPRQEPEKIRKWREEYQKKLEEKDREEERKIKELKDQAKRELEEWYKHHDETMGKTKSANRVAEKELVADVNGEVTPGQQWERISKLCDFNPKTSRNSKDVSRMRSIILQLKQNPPVKNL